MVYYLGKGREFNKEECKKYKTIEGALNALAKDQTLALWDETGKLIESGSGQQEDVILPEEITKAPEATEELSGNNSENPEVTEDDKGNGQQEDVIILENVIKATVICDGALNLRRTPTWGNDNICGRAMKGQIYFVKETHTVDGKKMLKTIDGIYLSGQPEHVTLN